MASELQWGQSGGGGLSGREREGCVKGRDKRCRVLTVRDTCVAVVD